ncbi:MAG TPA: WG repeat-containing protein, partial [Flavisolibacter sp.]|nr:WG repeat-containing protein [Flavisolibacter sp.]
MKLLLLALLSIAMSCFQVDPQPTLHLIVVNGKYGYIDQSGKEVISPIFHAAGEFAEGVAPVRQGGLYGYINTKGEFTIPPQFEFALPFKDGFAIVYKQEQPSYINKAGKQPFNTPFKEINNFAHGRAEVITYTQKHGFINTSGELIIDTVFTAIHPFVEGLAVVEGLEHDKEVETGVYKKEVGVIDTLGRFIVPYGRFDVIKDYREGYAYFDINEQEGDEDGETAQGGFIDRQGKVVMSRYNKNNSWIQGSLYNGLARISLYKHWLPEEKGVLWSSERSYEGYINLKGEIVYSDTSVVNATEFSYGRAFVGRKFEDYYLIDTNGKRVSPNGFRRVSEKGFVNGLAFVQKDYKWGLINTEGEFVVEPKFGEIDETLLNDKYFAFTEYVKNAKGEHHTRYGIASLNGDIVVKPILKDYDRSGFVG